MKVITNIYVFKTSDDIKTYKSIWDTGATETLISDKVVQELNLEETEEVELSTINGSIRTKRCLWTIIRKSLKIHKYTTRQIFA